MRHDSNVSIYPLLNLHEINGFSGIIVDWIHVNKYLLIVGHSVRFLDKKMNKALSQWNIYGGITRARNYFSCCDNMEPSTTITMEQTLSPWVLASSLSQRISKFSYRSLDIVTQLKVTSSPGKVDEKMEWRKLTIMVMSVMKKKKKKRGKKRLYISEIWAFLQLSNYYWINNF